MKRINRCLQCDAEVYWSRVNNSMRLTNLDGSLHTPICKGWTDEYDDVPDAAVEMPSTLSTLREMFTPSYMTLTELVCGIIVLAAFIIALALVF